ncbi:globin domain-containing protein [Prescottella sp. R16]|uniref:globin domain-containing protein n=1 Tax=Prescottella sp. R16 TaxID=3064529 RepID=UPI00272DE9AF|nr:globin domain-containing protein [Prescottella sp. R16]
MSGTAVVPVESSDAVVSEAVNGEAADAEAPNATLLSERSRPIIEATLPVVGEHLGEISELFYRDLFEALPSLKTDLFNKTNQENGEQQKALAGSIAAFATLLITEDAPPIDQVMERIAAKHASLGIVRMYYHLVHRALFKAIAQVLGDAVTPEVAAAWDEVYWLMADSLIAQEADMYARAGVSAGQVWFPLTVIDRRRIAPDVWTFTLSGFERCPMRNFEAGQYISVSMIFEDGSRQIRQYTAMAGAEPDTWEISVERIPGGLVSNKLVDEAGIGYPLIVSIPAGTPYPVPNDRPVVLGSSGVGSSLTVAVLQKMIADEDTRPVHVVHVDASAEAFGHRGAIEALLADYQGRTSLDAYVVTDVDDAVRQLQQRDWDRQSEVYLCGSPRFMRRMRKLAVLGGVAPERVHYEVFTPDSWLGFD